MSRLKRQKRGVDPQPRPTGPRWQGPPAPSPSPLRAAEELVRHVRPRSLARRALLLLRWADLRLPQLLDPDATAGLLLLAGLPWQRAPDTLVEATSAADLAARLLCRYPTPPTFLAVFQPRARRWRPADDDAVCARVAACVGRGGGYRDVAALLPGQLTRRVYAYLLASTSEAPLVASLRAAQVRAHGGPDWLAEALVAHAHFGALRVGLGPIAWLCRRDDIDRERLAEVLDFLAMNPVALEGRTFASVLRLSEAWHAARRAPVYPPADASPFPPSGLGEVVPEALARWMVRELRSTLDLVVEGNVLRHCVAIYATHVRAGRTSIWSVRFDARRRATLEVRNEPREVAQIRGVCNRRPDDDELAAIRAWAGANGLTVPEVAWR